MEIHPHQKKEKGNHLPHLEEEENAACLSEKHLKEQTSWRVKSGSFVCRPLGAINGLPEGVKRP